MRSLCLNVELFFPSLFHPVKSYSLKQCPAGRNDGVTMFLTPVSYDWKNPDRSQKEKTFTSNPNSSSVCSGER